jgi:putative photosynthetic complex assembly protein
MSDPFHGKTLPRAALAGAGLLVAAAIFASATARLTGIGTTRLPAAATVASVELRFLDREDGAVLVQRYPDETLIAVLPAGTNGFARGVLRGLARDRRLAHLGAGPPFRLVRWSDGRLSLEDPTTDRVIAIEAFGPTNAQVFADLLVSAQDAPAQEVLTWKQP